MNRFAALALCSPFLAAGTLNAQDPSGVVGGYQATATDAALVLEARDFIQGHLAILRLGRVLAASTQVVAGTNVKLVCEVSGEGPVQNWEFVAWHRLDGSWQFQSARRV